MNGQGSMVLSLEECPWSFLMTGKAGQKMNGSFRALLPAVYYTVNLFPARLIVLRYFRCRRSMRHRDIALSVGRVSGAVGVFAFGTEGAAAALFGSAPTNNKLSPFCLFLILTYGWLWV